MSSNPQFSAHHKAFFIALAEFVRGMRVRGGWRIFADMESYQNFLKMIEEEFAGVSAANLKDVDLSKVNKRVASILTSPDGEIFEKELINKS